MTRRVSLRRGTRHHHAVKSIQSTRETRDARARDMPLRLQKKASRVARAVVEEFNVARGVGTRTDKRGNAKTSLWDHGKVGDGDDG